jgi:hypothetical protein
LKPAKTLGKDGKDRPFQNNEAAYFQMDGCAIARGARPSGSKSMVEL